MQKRGQATSSNANFYAYHEIETFHLLSQTLKINVYEVDEIFASPLKGMSDHKESEYFVFFDEPEH